MQEFRINRVFSFLILMIAIFGLILIHRIYPESPKDETDYLIIVIYSMQALFAGAALYSYFSIRLLVSSQGVQLVDRWFDAISYKLDWWDIESVLNVSNPVNKQSIFFFYNSESKVLKQLNPHFFEPLEGSQYAQPFSWKERFFGSSQPTSLERAINKYADKKVEEAEMSDIRGLIKNSSADLGKEAQFMAFSSIIMFIIGWLLLLWGSSKHMLGDDTIYKLSGIFVLLFLVAFNLLPKKNKFSNTIISSLFAACATWLIIQCLHFYTLKSTPLREVKYYLVESKSESQIWQANGFPDIKIYADPGNLALDEIGVQQTIQLHSGPMQFYDVPREQVNKLLKKSQNRSLIK